jgi:hypothetical protein
MLTAAWNAHGFRFLDILPKRSKSDARYYLSHERSPLLEILAPYQDDPRRYFVIHTDNGRPHCSKTVPQFLDHDSLRRATHSRYSLDLTLSDFCIFEFLTGVLQRSSFDEPDELLSTIQKILRGIDRQTFEAVFQE